MRMQSEPAAARARGLFWVLWAVVLAVKIAVAARLPLFVDEAFYWQEGQHPAAAYSDLPGLTAWMVRLGVELGGRHLLGVRWPFLLVASLIPLMVVRIARRTFGDADGWTAGSFALLLPLAGSLGVLALPDPVLALATLVCLDAAACLLQRVDARHALLLALGLAVGALSHYRFLAVIGVGLLAMLAMPEGRRALRDPRVLIAVLFGAAAWTPLVWWNYDNSDAGLRFQLVDRHPWAFHSSGLWFIAIQALLVTPLLAVALLRAGMAFRRSPLLSARLLANAGLLVILGFFALGFFADTERVSFHWPLPGFLALVPLLPRFFDATWPVVRRLTALTAALGLVAVLGYYVAVSIPDVRARSAAEKWYPGNFAGWDDFADATRDELARMPRGTRIVAGDFKLGAELGFALGDPRIAVLDHPLNRKHGRAPQLALWGLDADPDALLGRGPVLLAEAPGDDDFKRLHARYLQLCREFGPLPAPRVVDVDHGRQRLLLFRIERRAAGACTAPAIAWIDRPVSGARVHGRVDVAGWAFRQSTGLERVDATLDGRVVGTLDYGQPYEGLDASWPGLADPNMPRLGFKGTVDVSGVAPGRHWLGLRVHAPDGSVEPWPEIPVDVAR